MCCRRVQAYAPYVLAGLGSTIDPNVATGYGVAGAVAAVAERLFGSLRGRRIFVQACQPKDVLAVACGPFLPVLHGAFQIAESTPCIPRIFRGSHCLFAMVAASALNTGIAAPPGTSNRRGPISEVLSSEPSAPLTLRQGTGKVGGVVAGLLGKAGAVVVCSDLAPGAVAAAAPGAEDGAQPLSRACHTWCSCAWAKCIHSVALMQKRCSDWIFA